MNKIQFPSAPLRGRSMRQKMIDKKWGSLRLDEKSALLHKAQYIHFEGHPDGASYEAKEAALKVLGK